MVPALILPDLLCLCMCVCGGGGVVFWPTQSTGNNVLLKGGLTSVCACLIPDKVTILRGSKVNRGRLHHQGVVTLSGVGSGCGW